MITFPRKVKVAVALAGVGLGLALFFLLRSDRAVSSAIVPTLSVLASPATASDSLPSDVAAGLAAHSGPLGPIDAGKARLVATVDGSDYWLIPASNGFCLAFQAPDGENGNTCATPEAVNSGLLAIGRPTSKSEYHIVGVVPDGVAMVSTESDSSKASRNAYVLSGAGRLTITRDDGSTSSFDWGLTS